MFKWSLCRDKEVPAVKIFISYSSKNRALVEMLADDLQSLGHDPWFDKELSGGRSGGIKS